MAFRNSIEAIDDLRRALSSVTSIEEVLDVLADEVRDAFRCEHVRIVVQDSGRRYEAVRGERSAGEGLRFEGGQVKLGQAVMPFPVFVSDPRRTRLDHEIVRYLDSLAVKSYAAVALYHAGAVRGWIECWTSAEYRHWTRDDSGFLQQIADFGALALERQSGTMPLYEPEVPALQAELSDLRSQYERIVEYGNLLIVRTNADLELVGIQGNTYDVLGVSPEELLNDRTVWGKFLHSPDLRDLGRKVRRMKNRPGDLNEEIRVVNQLTSEVRWLVVRGVPLLNEHGEFIGWEGFGLDITERHRAREELIEQSKRIEALYEVARALQVNLDPAVVTLKGLRALITATDSDCGFACFYDAEQKALELVSAEGLSPGYVEEVSKILNGPTLVRYAVEQREGLLINNIQKDTRAAVDIARKEGLRSTIIMPLLLKDEVQGVLVLFCRKANRYGDADFDLVSAAASQVCLAIRQAESYLAEKRQVGALAALYRLSHELAKQMTPREVAEHAFPIIQAELPCKRMWLGVVNEQGSHLLGQAGTGPGVRRHLIDIQIELDARHDFLDEAIKKKQAVVVRAGQAMECSQLARIVQRLNLGMFIIVPLVSLGQTVGVLIVEPALPSSFMIQRKLSLLTSMASEIATVILARRFEAKMADAEKMRMAGLLASGVAHNFNNMLQAVMGQASLIEMQLGKDSPLTGSAKMIIEAASKGASLIKQLLSFSMPGTSSKSTFPAGKMLTDSADLYRSVLGSTIALEMRVDGEVAEIFADYSKVQQVITNLLMNAKEAIGERHNGLVRVTARRVRLSSGEVDPELAPGAYVRIDVEDNGAGMDAERQSRCFEPFFTTKDVDARTGLGFNGSGLGLSSAYSIVKNHEGSITVTSTLGEGSVFSLYLPVAVREPAKTPEQIAEKKAEEKIVPKVLIASQESRSNVALLSTLDSFGTKLVYLEEGESLAEALDQHGDSVQLVITDDAKGGAQVRESIESARVSKADLRFLILSSRSEELAAELSALSGAAILAKPVSVWAVQAALKKLLLGKSTASLSAHVRVEKDDEKSSPSKSTPAVSSLSKEPQ
ncbi:MAG: GAF domain-containing protein [Deltaproteobacteria bacterium]|nr:GAF domain-containing protein [Deltaproteobacteria bacterium]